MVQSRAKTVAAYLKELPPERRKIVAELRRLMKRRLPPGYEEAMEWGMITYQVPFKRYPHAGNDKPLCYAALAAQKNGYSLYGMCIYTNKALHARLRAAFKKMGQKPDMGKSCIRFKRLEDLPLDVIGDLIAAVPVEQYIEIYEKSQAQTWRRAGRKQPGA
jgi:Domain of unknown function (DU1801)